MLQIPGAAPARWRNSTIGSSVLQTGSETVSSTCRQVYDGEIARGLMPRRSPKRTRWTAGALAVVFVTVIVALWGPGTIGALVVSPHSPAVPSGASELASASLSLEHGAGPAMGESVSCAAASSGSVNCQTPSDTPTTFSANAKWTNITTKVIPAPVEREGIMTWDAADGYVLLYGGESRNLAQTAYYNQYDTWTYLNGVWTNITSQIVGGFPPASVAPAMSYDPFTGYVLLFGGYNNTVAFQKSTWTYHAGEWTNISNTAGTPPAPRIVPALVPDLATGQMILFGGVGLNKSGDQIALSDTWLFKAGTWSNITSELSGPAAPAILYPTAAYDSVESGILLEGPIAEGSTYAPVTLLFASGGWENLTSIVSTPPPLQLAGVLAWFGPENAMVLSSSLELTLSGSEIVFPVTWAFYQGNWINITVTAGVAPSSTLGGTAVLPDGSILLFGGLYAVNSLGDYTYLFSLPPVASGLTVAPKVVDLGTATVASASVSGGVAPYTQNFSWGDGTYSGGSTQAHHTYTKTGKYNVTFNETDFLGRSVSVSANVTVNAALSVAPIVATPASPTAGTNVTLRAVASGGTPPYSYSWTLGDGTTASTSSVLHAYANSGNYTATVTVNDSTGAHATVNVTITVTAPPSPSSSSPFSLFSGTGLYLLLGIVVAVVVIAAVVVLVRGRGKRSRPPAQTWQSPPSPPSGASPEVGPSGVPPPPPPPPP
jgi:chitodextrinase